jgi:hypothetical protein
LAEFKAWWESSNKFGKQKLSGEALKALTDAAQLYRSVDKNGDGTLDEAEFGALYAELVKHNYTTKSQAEAFAELDTVRRSPTCTNWSCVYWRFC